MGQYTRQNDRQDKTADVTQTRYLSGRWVRVCGWVGRAKRSCWKVGLVN